MTTHFTHTSRRKAPRLTLIALGILQLYSAGPASAGEADTAAAISVA